MQDSELKCVTIIYYDVDSLELKHQVMDLPVSQHGRVIIPDEFKKKASIVAVCEGKVNVLNKIGERVLSMSQIA
ncbi:TIGR02922 family protein [Thalassotalea aquiviva]|uniref:TIGR02922 family protein n=1 Tax=Thalassotalea aquiviva TaxID=3242415 RepID=UPI003529E864